MLRAKTDGSQLDTSMKLDWTMHNLLSMKRQDKKSKPRAKNTSMHLLKASGELTGHLVKAIQETTIPIWLSIIPKKINFLK